MIKKTIQISQIIPIIENMLFSVKGNIDNLYIDNIADTNRVSESSLDWINPTKKNKQQIAEQSKAKVMLVDDTIEYSLKIQEEKKVLLVVNNPKFALMSIIKELFKESVTPGVDPSAFVHPEAIIGEGTYIGPNCYIGKCKIGKGNVIHSGVNIYDRTEIGNNNVIHSGAVICVDGLGCMRHENGNLEEFPQIGGVIIGDNCYIGANTHIASGSLSDTIIESGCKINGMCFIGSNDHLHQNVWITGSTMLAGSVEIGRDTNIFSRVVVRDWCTIGQKVTIGMGAVVTKNIPDGETWFGSPAHKVEKK